MEECPRLTVRGGPLFTTRLVPKATMRKCGGYSRKVPM